jgi:hypothetical protein
MVPPLPILSEKNNPGPGETIFTHSTSDNRMGEKSRRSKRATILSI